MEDLSAVATALAALFAAVSALASWRATRTVEAEQRVNNATAQFQLFRSFEDAYSALYPSLWESLGPWEDPVQTDPAIRRSVHGLCQTLCSVYLAQRLELVDEEHAEYAAELFLDWMRQPQAASVWEGVFAKQTDTWPAGFVSWMNARLSGDPKQTLSA